MTFINQIERIKKIHSLIQTETTGNPAQFAQQMRLSRSHLYNLIENIKEMDAQIKYCKKKVSFYHLLISS